MQRVRKRLVRHPPQVQNANVIGATVQQHGEEQQRRQKTQVCKRQACYGAQPGVITGDSGGRRGLFVVRRRQSAEQQRQTVLRGRPSCGKRGARQHRTQQYAGK